MDNATIPRTRQTETKKATIPKANQHLDSDIKLSGYGISTVGY